MTTTTVHKIFAPLRRVLPSPLAQAVRSFVTAFLTPLRFSIQSGHFRSSWQRLAISKKGQPIPWYTYPAVDFLRARDFRDAEVLELGAGQSTLWWSRRAAAVVAFEGDERWFESLLEDKPESSRIFLADMRGREACEASIRSTLVSTHPRRFDVVVIDGLFREQMVPIALDYVSDDGMIIVDNADGYGMGTAFADVGLLRADFYGYAPGVYLPHCTSIYFRPSCRWFSGNEPIVKIALVDHAGFAVQNASV
jgi:hypothetical protein